MEQASKRITTSAIPSMNLQDFRKLSAELRKQWSAQNAEQPFFISNRLSNDMQIQEFSLKTQQGLHVKRQKKSRKTRMTKSDTTKSDITKSDITDIENNSHDVNDDMNNDMNDDDSSSSSDSDETFEPQPPQTKQSEQSEQFHQIVHPPHIPPTLTPITNLPYATELLNAMVIPVPKLPPKLSKGAKKIKK